MIVGKGCREGCLVRAKALFSLFTHRQSPLPRVLKEFVIASLGLVRCQSLSLHLEAFWIALRVGDNVLSPLNNFDRCSAMNPY